MRNRLRKSDAMLEDAAEGSTELDTATEEAATTKDVGAGEEEAG